MSSIKFDPSHGPEIIKYYYTNYTDCPKVTSYFATSQFLTTFTHSVLVVQLPLVILTGYCILKKTPKAMGSLKWAMFNLHFWNSFVDVLFCSLITPYVFFPTFSGFTAGLFSAMGVPYVVQAFITFGSMGFMFSSIAALFENRSSSFEMNKFRFKSSTTRLIVFLSNGVIFAMTLPPILFNLPDQNEAKYQLLTERLICPTTEFFTSPIFVLSNDWFWNAYLATVLITEFVLALCAAGFFNLCSAYCMFFAEHVTYSANTKKLQKIFFVGNLVQIAIPFLLWTIPGGFIFASCFLDFYDQVLTNIGMAIVSLHGVATMIAILFIHHPYRTFILSCLSSNPKRKYPISQHIQVTVVLKVM